jgi:hypothetical protein
MTVVVVAVVMMAVVVMAVVAMMAVVAAVMATMMATAVAAAVPAGRSIARGGEGRDGQNERSSSGGEDGTLHFRLLLGCSRATIALGCVSR